MRKVLAFLLALTLVFSLSATALAAGASDYVTDPTEKDVTVTVTGGATATTYSIKIDWGNMAFTYQQGDRIWDQASGKYLYYTGSWVDGNSSTVTVTNRSNTPVTVEAELEPVVGSNFTASLSSTGKTLASYAERPAAEPDSVSITVTVVRSAQESELSPSENVKIGTVKLTIS